MQAIHRRFVMYLLIFAALVCANVFSVGIAIDRSALIYPNVIINGENIGGLSIENAQKVIENISVYRTNGLTVNFGEKKWLLKPQTIDLEYDNQKTAEMAFNLPRTGSVAERFFALHRTYNLKPIIKYDSGKLEEWICLIAKQIDEPAISASIKLNEIDIYENFTGNFPISPEKKGLLLNRTQAIELISNAFALNQDMVTLVTDVDLPIISKNELEQVNAVLAIYKTNYNQDGNRTHNIELASKKLNDKLLKVGEVLSFNSIVGERTELKGYVKAPVYIDDTTLGEDWGGGVCQLSSTLYNAALLANLTVIERTSHYRPVTYVPVGLDATVDFNSNLDLKLKNKLNHPVYFKTIIENDGIIIIVLGRNEDKFSKVTLATTNMSIIEPKTVIKQDQSLPAGMQVLVQESQPGFNVTIERIINNGESAYHELISEDIYQPVDEIIRFGVKVDNENK